MDTLLDEVLQAHPGDRKETAPRSNRIEPRGYLAYLPLQIQGSRDKIS